MEPRLKAAFNPDSYTPLEIAVNNIEMIFNQSDHLAMGAERLNANYQNNVSTEKEMDVQILKIKQSVAKVMAQNRVLEGLIKSQEIMHTKRSPFKLQPHPVRPEELQKLSPPYSPKFINWKLKQGY